MASSSLLRRALFYVPASSPKHIAKSLTLKSDNVTYDLEDSVSLSSKDAALGNLLGHLRSLDGRPRSIREVAARVNPVQTAQGSRELTALAALPLVDAILLPKVDSSREVLEAAQLVDAADLKRRDAFETLRQRQISRGINNNASDNNYRRISLIALVESARAIEDLREICTALHGRESDSGEPLAQLSGLVFGAEDFARDLSITRTPSLAEFQYARSKMVTAARAYDIPSIIDLVCTSYKEPARLEEECRNGRGMGFSGKQVIHPGQLETVNSLFGVSDAEAEWAVRIVVANTKAEAQGRGAWAMDNQMIDAPVIGRAQALVERARLCGIDADALMEKWKDQQPE
ncbi:uncharacterized protein PgNI_04664 [Pyricularia grisea]|uniref:HpcH/HpaI aldolase/citrate lyase domain-containing protein n=1 Tax=Pyricularia grisea TaxID=148305 RepID=A0A6P8BA91_PYRGI|nr:uncharacterized protein PgNI_04664 [Pyricularia grisea]TLD12733.1 hypothetical protein PgNI_04664 [Pyricularia grisea]